MKKIVLPPLASEIVCELKTTGEPPCDNVWEPKTYCDALLGVIVVDPTMIGGARALMELACKGPLIVGAECGLFVRELVARGPPNEDTGAGEFVGGVYVTTVVTPFLVVWSIETTVVTVDA